MLPAAQLAEISRKVLHLASATIPLVYVFVAQDAMLRLLTPCVVITVVIELLRHLSPGFQRVFRRLVGFMLRSAEWPRVTGATYVMVAALLSVWLFPKPVAIAALLILSISDSAASLIGLHFGRVRFLGKSLAGSLAFFVTALAILWIVLPDFKGLAASAAALATLVEALPVLKLGRLELNDNLTIPLLTGAAICLLQVGSGSAAAAIALSGC